MPGGPSSICTRASLGISRPPRFVALGYADYRPVGKPGRDRGHQSSVTRLILEAGPDLGNFTGMIDIRPFASLGHADHGWLDARHHFSFANYYDPARMGWGRIRVWNDDKIAGQD